MKAPTLRRYAGRCPPKGALPALGRPGGGHPYVFPQPQQALFFNLHSRRQLK